MTLVSRGSVDQLSIRVNLKRSQDSNYKMYQTIFKHKYYMVTQNKRILFRQVLVFVSLTHRHNDFKQKVTT